MRASDYTPSYDDILIKTYLDKFKGEFGISISGRVEYYDQIGEVYAVPETKTEFFDMVSKSLKSNKNLFLDFPIDYPKSENGKIPDILI